MKIPISELRPNPFRDLQRLPVDRKSVEALKCSIRSTGFWDNLLVRREYSDEPLPIYQIAYGHCRVSALYELVLERVIESEFMVELPVRVLDDATMLRIMLNENADIAHGVYVTREFLHKETQTPREEIEAADICQFLGGTWGDKHAKVRKALKTLNTRL